MSRCEPGSYQALASCHSALDAESMDPGSLTGVTFDEHLRISLESKFAGQVTKPHRTLKEAMTYALLGEGKRIRPKMVFESAKRCNPNASWRLALPAALAVEYVHAYSLIHDDLPCMDDDDMRRGKPTLHRQFGEAVAILAGDALLSDAFGFVAQAKIQPARQCQVLSEAIGSSGMVLGQVDDVTCSKKTFETLKNKTGKLFECACRLGAISVGASKEREQEMAQWGLNFGIEFQLQDNLDDSEPMDF